MWKGCSAALNFFSLWNCSLFEENFRCDEPWMKMWTLWMCNSFIFVPTVVCMDGFGKNCGRDLLVKSHDLSDFFEEVLIFHQNLAVFKYLWTFFWLVGHNMRFCCYFNKLTSHRLLENIWTFERNHGSARQSRMANSFCGNRSVEPKEVILTKDDKWTLSFLKGRVRYRNIKVKI